MDDLRADSLDVIEITMAVEELFGIDIPDDEVERIVTVEDLLETLAKHLKRHFLP